MMHLLYPGDTLDTRSPEEQYLPEIEAAERAGFRVSLVSLEYLQMGERRIFPAIPAEAIVLYRGYMLDSDGYGTLARFVDCSGAKMHTSLDDYLRCHHLPNWYPLISDLTMETKVFPESGDLVSELRQLGWPGYFLKDYVKSLKTGIGSRIRHPEEAAGVIANMRKFRGRIEGGVCVRRVTEFEPDSETRCFVVRGEVFSSEGEVPGVAKEAARRIFSPYFSVDVARTIEGRTMIVEVGDGQVSDTVGWDLERFVEVLAKIRS